MFQELLEQSRRKLLALVRGVEDVTLILGWGNIGDQLIYAGARQLLAQVNYREVKALDLAGAKGYVGLVCGGGSWCRPWHEMPRVLPEIEARFETVIVLPSSYDISEISVRSALERSKSLFCARAGVLSPDPPLVPRGPRTGYGVLLRLPPLWGRAAGVLNAFRTDAERAGVATLPPDNRDLSADCETLDEWLWAISRKEVIRTDRAHVMIAGAMLGKTVEYLASCYHKVPGIARYALQEFPVSEIRRCGTSASFLGRLLKSDWLRDGAELRACEPMRVTGLRQ